MDLNKLKYLKLHRKKRIIRVNKGIKGQKLSNYNFGMVIKESAVFTEKQITALRKLIVRKLKGKSNKNQRNLKIIKSQVKVKKTKKKKTNYNFFLRNNFNLGLTKKPLQVRMGKGKGNPVDWVYPCGKNRILMEFFQEKKITKIKKILLKASEKLPCSIKFISKKKITKKKKIINFTSNNIQCIKEL